MAKKDNQTLRQKVSLRLRVLREIECPSVVETHGGTGGVFRRCYRHLTRGVVFEIDEQKASMLAEQRPTWAVYEADCMQALAAGIGQQFEPNFFDIDPYGECWPIIDAVLSSTSQPTIVFVVNDGLRQKLKMNGGWKTKSMAPALTIFTNDDLYRKYLDVCRWMIEQKAGEAGYRLARWTAYHCGLQKNMTHFAAVLQVA